MINKMCVKMFTLNAAALNTTTRINGFERTMKNHRFWTKFNFLYCCRVCKFVVLTDVFKRNTSTQNNKQKAKICRESQWERRNDKGKCDYPHDRATECEVRSEGCTSKVIKRYTVMKNDLKSVTQLQWKPLKTATSNQAGDAYIYIYIYGSIKSADKWYMYCISICICNAYSWRCVINGLVNGFLTAKHFAQIQRMALLYPTIG